MKSKPSSAQLPRAAARRSARSSSMHKSSMRAATATELLVVMMLMGILGTLAVSIFTPSRKHTNLHGEALKINKLFSLARSYAVSSDEKYYQVTFQADNPPSYWLDEIAASDPTDFQTVPVVLKRQITTPEQVFDQVQIARIIGGIFDPKLNTHSLRFFPDGTSDEGAIYVIRKAGNSTAAPYQKIRLYGPTSRSEVFENVELPNP